MTPEEAIFLAWKQDLPWSETAVGRQLEITCIIETGGRTSKWVVHVWVKDARALNLWLRKKDSEGSDNYNEHLLSANYMPDAGLHTARAWVYTILTATNEGFLTISIIYILYVRKLIYREIKQLHHRH